MTVNQANNQISYNTIAGQIATYCYDSAGNLIYINAPAASPGLACPTSSFQYTYDAENHLVNTANVTYTYDGDGKRVQKSNGTLYWYGTSSDPLSETDASGNTTADYVYFGGKRIAMVPTNAVSNGSFEVGLQAWSYWGTGITAQLISTPSLCYSGNDCLQLSNSDSGQTGDTDNQLIPVAVGQTISLSAWVYQQSGGNGTAYWQLAVFDANSSTTGIAYVAGSPSSSTGTWVNETASYTVPTWATCPCYAYIYASLNTGSQSDVARFDAATVNVSGSGASDALYYLTDHLGTSRVITNSAGSLCYDADFYPFGGERAITNTCPQNYKFTAKERDAESGLDNFDKRYYGSSSGRLMSPDPVFFQAEMLADPQRFNEYTYARNNPLLYIDPSGEAIQLSGNPENQQQQLLAICSAAGIAADKCSYYIYANKASDGNYYVGIYTNGADGKGTSFQDLNDVASAFGSVINDQRVAQLDLVAAGKRLTDNEGHHRTIGPVDPNTGITPAGTYLGPDGRWHIALLDPATAPGSLPGTMMSNGQPGHLDQGIMIAHELGHLRTEWGLESSHWLDSIFDPHGNAEAVKLENKARKLQDPNAPTRRSHDYNSFQP